MRKSDMATITLGAFAALALFVLVIALNVVGILLVGWAGVVFANAVIGSHYPVYVGFIGAFILRSIIGWFTWFKKRA